MIVNSYVEIFLLDHFIGFYYHHINCTYRLRTVAETLRSFHARLLFPFYLCAFLHQDQPINKFLLTSIMWDWSPSSNKEQVPNTNWHTTFCYQFHGKGLNNSSYPNKILWYYITLFSDTNNIFTEIQHTENVNWLVVSIYSYDVWIKLCGSVLTLIWLSCYSNYDDSRLSLLTINFRILTMQF